MKTFVYTDHDSHQQWIVNAGGILEADSVMKSEHGIDVVKKSGMGCEIKQEDYNA